MHRTPGLQSTLLIGREGDLVGVEALLNEPGVRLVTITGGGGFGKTALALEMCQRAATRGRRTVIADLAPVREAVQIIPAIARALGFDSATGGDLETRVTSDLDATPTLLVLDNLEHLDAAPVVSRMLAHTRLVSILATSRGRLKLRTERVYRLGPLPLPPASADLTPDIVTKSPATRLLATRMQQVRPDLRITSDNASAFLELSQRLEGIPLAIELAANHAQVLSVQQMLARFETYRDLLQDGDLDRPQRHRAMEASIAWSLDLLPHDVRDGFAHLCLFTGGFSDEDARAIAGVDLRGLELLVEHGLIHVFGDSNPRRYRILVPIREEGRKLPADLPRFHRRLAGIIAGMNLGVAGSNPESPDHRLLHTLWSYVDDGLMVFDWYIANAEPAELADLVVRCGVFWSIHCDAMISRDWLDRVVQRLESSDAAVPLDQVARVHHLRGNAAYRGGLFDEAIVLLSDALPHARASGSHRHVAQTIFNLIAVLRESNRFDEAAALLDEARLAAEAIGSQVFRWRWLYESSMQALARREFERAMDIADAAMQVATSLEDPDQPIGVTLALIGHIEMLHGELDAADDAYRASIDRLSDHRFETPRYSSLAGRARVALRRGDLQAASALLHECLAAQFRRGNPVWTTLAFVDAGWLAHLAGDDERAAILFGAAGVATSADLDLFVADAVAGVVDGVRERLGEAAFRRLHRSGRSTPRAGIVAQTLDWLCSLPGSTTAGAPLSSILTRREREVLELVATGLTDREIARHLSVSPHTVGTHIKRIHRKFGVSSRASAVMKGVQLGLITQTPAK